MSILLFMTDIFNIISLYTNRLVHNIYDSIEDMLWIIVPGIGGKNGIAYFEILLALVMIVIGTISIALINNFVGTETDKRYIKRSILFRNPMFIMDIVIGAFLEILAFRGIWKMQCYVTNHLLSAQNILYFIAFICGSACYWYEIFPIDVYIRLINCIKKSKGEIIEPWLLISDSSKVESSFRQMPVKKECFIPMINIEELNCINKIFQTSVAEKNFLKCVIYLDDEGEVIDRYYENIEKILHIPHLKVKIFQCGKSENGEVSRKKMQEKINWKIKEDDIISLENDGQDIIFKLIKCLKKNSFYGSSGRGNPLGYLRISQLGDYYMELWKGPRINYDLLVLCMNKMEIQPSIYALFDYIDLQYRICCAYICTGERWCVKNNGKLRNIRGKYGLLRCAGYISKKAKSDCFNSKDVIDSDERKIIETYLPDYIEPENYNIEQIMNISAELRNVLRGHGAASKEHLMALYRIIFRLAIMTSYMLNVNDGKMEIQFNEIYRITDTKVTFYKVILKKDESTRNGSPFLLGTRDGTIWVFKSCEGNFFEYINYLDGTIVKI